MTCMLMAKNTFPILFADDTNLFTTGTDLDVMQNTLNDELNEVSTWFKVNKLPLNVKKTHYMIYTWKKMCKKSITLKINGQDISEVMKTKCLGVIFDNKINWKDHINYIAGKISCGIGMIIKARKYLQKPALITLYYSFIYRYLTYVTNIMKLEKLQNKVLRIICNRRRRDSIVHIYKELGVIRFKDINKYLIERFMFRFCNANVPVLFHSYFQRNNEFHNYQTRTASHLHIPSMKTDIGQTSIRYRGALIWNGLVTMNVDHNSSEAVFVKLLKRVIESLPQFHSFSLICGNRVISV